MFNIPPPRPCRSRKSRRRQPLAWNLDPYPRVQGLGQHHRSRLEGEKRGGGNRMDENRRNTVFVCLMVVILSFSHSLCHSQQQPVLSLTHHSPCAACAALALRMADTGSTPSPGPVAEPSEPPPPDLALSFIP